jgi:hypothetical protein
MRVMLRSVFLFLSLLLAVPALAGPVCDAVWRDTARGRDLPLRIRLPDGDSKVPGRKYLIVFQDGDHMVFAGNRRRAPTAPDSHIQTVAARLTSAFRGMALLGDTADAALLSSGITPLLADGDRFETK